MGNIFYLVAHDFKLDYRQKFAIGGILLYLVTTVYIVYKVFNQPDADTWNAVFWIIFILLALSVILKSFVLSDGGMKLYYYTIYNPAEYLLAKCIYNAILLFTLALILFLLMSLFFSHPVQNLNIFLISIGLGSIGISIQYSFVSAIAAGELQNSVLTAILALPVVIPIILLALHISAVSMGLKIDTSIRNEVLLLSGISLIMLGLAVILFPHIWKS